MIQLPRIVEEEVDKIKHLVDGIGRPVDDGIVLTVAALRCHGFTPTASCEGHAERTSPPWVDIESSDAPKLIKIMQDGAHSGPEFLQNRKAVVDVNRQENRRLFRLLTEFYESHQPSYPTVITVTEIGPGYGRLCPHASYLVDLSNQHEYGKWLQDAQSEMSTFADFLCSKLT
jgi:hypothetical protein